MLRRDGLSLTDEDGETRHPDDIDAALADLIEHARPPEESHPAWEATWHLHIWFDPEERRDQRQMQRSQMGRYMHQSVLQWDGVDVSTFGGYYDCLSRILGKEEPLETAAEDQA